MLCFPHALTLGKQFKKIWIYPVISDANHFNMVLKKLKDFVLQTE